MEKKLLIVGVIILAAAMAVIFLGGKGKVEPQMINLNSNEILGEYLVDAKGMTLYYFLKDIPGKSNCEDQCLAAWPIFYASDIAAGPGLNKNDFKSIVRDDGKSQLIYKDWPLYYYYQDKNPGDTLGEGVGKVWYVMKNPFYTIMAVNKEGHGNYLVDSKGRALYYFTNDTAKKSNCVNSCLGIWPAFYSEKIVLPSLLEESDFSVLARPDSQKQLAYQSKPLYYYVNDSAPGDTKGENINNVWFTMKIK